MTAFLIPRSLFIAVYFRKSSSYNRQATSVHVNSEFFCLKSQTRRYSGYSLRRGRFPVFELGCCERYLCWGYFVQLICCINSENLFSFLAFPNRGITVNGNAALFTSD